MGMLFYDDEPTPLRVDDRALTHLLIVIAAKLRQHESFTLTWQHPHDSTPGMTTIWLHPSIALRFVFDDPEPPPLNRRWLEELMRSASSLGGIHLVDEAVDDADHSRSAS